MGQRLIGRLTPHYLPQSEHRGEQATAPQLSTCPTSGERSFEAWTVAQATIRMRVLVLLRSRVAIPATMSGRCNKVQPRDRALLLSLMFLATTTTTLR